MGNFDEAIDIKGSIIYEANVPPRKSNSWQHEIEVSTWFKNQYGGCSKLRQNMFTVIQRLKINIILLPDGRPQRRAGA